MNSYKIGLDFGTTNSIISYLKQGEPIAYKYGSPGQQEEYIPSFITYEEDFIEIGNAARMAATNDANIESYGNFKMQLPIAEQQFSSYVKNGRNPIQLTTDYLRQLFLSPDNSYNFSQQEGEISGIVVSVPELWQRNPQNLGRERLQQIITEELQLPLIQLVSEPVAAAAYYAWKTQTEANEKSESLQNDKILLVCDIGGGTFDVSACRIYAENKVEVLYFDGEGDQGLEAAGVAFDRRCVQTAYQKAHQEPIDENNSEFQRLLKEFESVKLSSHNRATKKLINYFKDKEVFGQENAYTFSGKYSITFSEVEEAFTPIKEGIIKIMKRVKSWLNQNNYTFNNVFMVGGFSQFLLVQRAITEALEISNDDERFDRSFNLTNSAYAISYGACLIANGLVEPTEKYVHTLGLVVHEENQQCETEEKYITLISGNVALKQLCEPIFKETTTIAFHENIKIKLWIDPLTRGKKYRKEMEETITLPNHSSQAKYQVGMRVDSSQIAYLVVKEINTKKIAEYKLGNIIAQAFPTFVITE